MSKSTSGSSKKSEIPSYFRIRRRVVHSAKFKDLGESEKILYYVLCDLWNSPGNGKSFWRTDKQLIEDVGGKRKWSRSKFFTARKALSDKGFIEWSRGKKLTTYKVLDFIEPRVESSGTSWLRF
jgi:hypothetical protein